MAKSNPSKVKVKVKGVPNKHLHARTTFLYQAATYLTLQCGPQEMVANGSQGRTSQAEDSTLEGTSSLAIELGSQLQTVSRKGQVRLSAELKRSICKCCNAILIPGRTATQTIVNDSKGGRKPWSDVLVLTCTFCSGVKRFPVGAKQQKRKAERSSKAAISTKEDSNTTTTQSSTAVDSNTPSSISQYTPLL